MKYINVVGGVFLLGFVIVLFVDYFVDSGVDCFIIVFGI